MQLCIRDMAERSGCPKKVLWPRKYYNETTLIEMKYITNDGRYDQTVQILDLRTLPLSQKEYVTTGQMAKLPHGQSDHLDY